MTQTQGTMPGPKKIDLALAELRDARRLADTNMEEVPVKMRPGRLMAKNQAAEALPGLIAAVRAATIPTRLVGLYAAGDPGVIARVGAFMAERHGIVVDAGLMYRHIAEYVEAAFGGGRNRTFNTTCFTRMVSCLREQEHLFGIKPERNPDYEEAITPTLTDVVDHVRKLVRAAYGDSRNQLVVSNMILDAVVNGNLTDKRIPVLVVNSTEDEQGSLSSLFSRARAFEFAPDFDVSEESVASILKGR